MNNEDSNISGIIYLNGISILSFKVNNVYETYSVQNYYFNENQIERDGVNSFTFSSNVKNENNNQFWIIQENDKYVIKQTSYLNISNNNMSIGPFFNKKNANLILNYLDK